MIDFDIKWLDSGREPTQQPDPQYPTGIDVDIADGAVVRCQVDVPYPAKRCGVYSLRCKICGLTAIVTTAGRPDDPRSVIVGCKS